jgi:DNA (cytosine-5)-methyltransferase 1
MLELRCLSLFANVGIAEAMFHEIGVKVLIANELVEDRARFYHEVYPETHMICGDITDTAIRDSIVSEAINKKINFIIATPPCQGMSVAGNRDDKDPRNQLIYYAIDVIKRVNPAFVMLENVPRQLTTKIKIGDELIKIPDYIRRELEGDYQFNTETLAKAKDFSVPQLRERNIFLLVRKDIGIVWEFPSKQREVFLEEAIGKLPSLDPQLREGIALTREKFPDFDKKREEGMKVSKWHHPPIHPWRQVEWMMHTPTGKSAIYNEVYYPKNKDGSEIKAHHNHYRRMRWDMPARTITMFNNYISTLATVHPGRPYEKDGEILYSDPRALSVYELLIVMAIPLDWPIPDWVDDSFLRSVIGEGIPSKMARDIVKELLDRLNAIDNLD